MSKPTEFSTVKEIKEYLDSKGVEYHKRAKKVELVKLLRAVPNLENEELDVTEQTMLPANPKRDYMSKLLSGNDDFLRNLDSYVFLHADGLEMQKNLQEAKFDDKDVRDHVIDLEELNDDIESESTDGISLNENIESGDQIDVIDIDDGHTDSESNEEPVVTTPSIDEAEVDPVYESVEDEVIEVIPSKNSYVEEPEEDGNKKRLILTIAGVMLAVFLVVFFALKYLM